MRLAVHVNPQAQGMHVGSFVVRNCLKMRVLGVAVHKVTQTGSASESLGVLHALQMQYAQSCHTGGKHVHHQANLESKT